jgi:hypothetical protein
VPEPDISLHFLIQLLKRLNQVPNNLIQDLTAAPPAGSPVGKFLKGITGLAAFANPKSKS